MSFPAINLNSIRFRITLLFLVLAILLSVGVTNTLYHSFFEAGQSASNKLRSELSNHLNRATGVQAIERGVGNTIIGGNRNLLRKFQDLGAEGDTHVRKAAVSANEIINRGFVSPDFKDMFATWVQAHERLRDARPRVMGGGIGASEWLDIATDNIMRGFDLQDLIFAPRNESEQVLYYTSLLRSHIASLTEYAGRERAIIGYTLAAGSEITRKNRILLERYRGRVDGAIRRIRTIRDNASTTPQLKKAIINFEKIFLGNYQDLRRQIFAVSDANSQIAQEIQGRLKKAGATVLDNLHGVNIQLSSLAGNIHLKEQVKRLINGEAMDLSQVGHFFEDLLADIERRYRRVRYLDDKGRERLRIDYTGGQSRAVAENDLQDKSGRYYFTESRNLPRGQIYISPLDLNVEEGRISVPFIPMLRFAAPVFVDGQRHGVVVLNVDAGRFLDALPGDSILADQEGYYLRHPAREKEWGMMEALDRGADNLRAEFPDIADAMFSGKPEKIVSGDKTFFVQPVYFHPSNPNKYWLLILRRVPIPYPVTSRDWIEKATEAIDSALAISRLLGEMAEISSAGKTKTAGIMVGISVVLAMVMAVIVVIFFAELVKVGRKTGTIRKELRRLASGDLGRRINFAGNLEGDGPDIRPRDEIDAIGTDINKMAASLEIQTGELLAAKGQAETSNRAKSEFLAAMSHDLRTPLNAILGFADILSHQYFGPTSEKYKEYAENIHSSGEHLLELVSDILDLSTIEAGKRSLVKEKLSIMEIVTECERIVEEKARSNGIDLVMEVAKDLPPLYADRRAFKQILLNLLANAVKFTPEGGKITVSAKASKKNTILKVSDTGRGISAEKLPGLTDPFTKGGHNPYLAEKGWGLGLTITKSLIDLHDGELDIESKVGKGTVVTVTLPNGARRNQSASSSNDSIQT
tara:strand:+ start:119 stop:2884 length:2766 start_codon:yes stop_codon:yes gene_type:complete